MREKEKRSLVRDCLNAYYKKDKEILIDVSVLQITCIPFLLYNQIFFGNKVIIFKETLDEMIRIKIQPFSNIEQEIRIRNAGNLLEAIERDNYNNYKIIERKGSYRKFLLENPNCIFYLADENLYQELNEHGLKRQLVLLQKGMIEVNPFRNRDFKFETIGSICFKDGKMLINDNKTSFIKVYNSKGKEKNHFEEELKPRDFVLIRGDKDTVYSFNLYEIVSTHTRNQALRIIWTDLNKGQKSNKYIDRLPYQYKKMILDNIK